MFDNVVNISTGFRSLSNQMEMSLVTPKVEPTNPSTLLTPSSAPSASCPPGTSSSRLFTRELLTQLPQDNFPKVGNWFTRDYNTRQKSRKKSMSDNERGKSSILSCYMEDKNGEEVSESAKEAVRTMARAFFELLLKNERAPAVWGSAPVDIRNEYLYVMETAHPFLQFCQDHWKASKVAPNSYSQWLSNSTSQTAIAKGKRRARSEVIDVDTDEDDNGEVLKQTQETEEDTPGSSKRPCMGGDQSAPPSSPPLQRSVHSIKRCVSIDGTLCRRHLTGPIVRIV